MTAIPDICAPIHRRRGAPAGNRNALKSGRYTAEAKKERRRRRLLLRQLRAGLEYARSVIRARDAAARLSIISQVRHDPEEKIFKNRKTIPARRRSAPRHSAYVRRLPHSGMFIYDSPRAFAGVTVCIYVN
jgi:hypothetical protein